MTAKAFTGISLTFFEALLAAFLLNIISVDTILPLAIFILLAALLVVPLAFILGALGRDMLATIKYATVFLIVLIIPGFVLIFPGIYSSWINAIPTYYMVSPLDGIVNYGFALSNYLSDIVYLGLFDVVLFLIGFFVLRRRLA
jgi:hypothetical protein